MSNSLVAEIGKSMLFAFPPRLRSGIVKLAGDSSQWKNLMHAKGVNTNTWHTFAEFGGKQWVTRYQSSILQGEWASIDGQYTVRYSDDFSNEESYWKSSWLTPHLAGLHGEESPDFVMNFKYDQFDHTYALLEVMRFKRDDSGAVVGVYDVPLVDLIRVWYQECRRNDGISPPGDAVILDWLRQVSSSDDPKLEALRRHTKGVLREWSSYLKCGRKG